MSSDLLSSAAIGLTGLSAASAKMNAASEAIAGSGVAGFRRTVIETSSVRSNNSGSGNGVTTNSRATISQRGGYQQTNVVTDLAVKDGDGLFVMRTPTGEIVYKTTVSLQVTPEGLLADGSGNLILGWDIDNKGNLPGQGDNPDTTNFSLVQSLSPINVKNLTGAAASTNKVDIAINLNADTPTLRGSGQTLAINGNDNINGNIKDTEIIIPNSGAFGSIAQGDIIAITSSPPNITHNFKYGGVVETKQPTVGTPLLGATSATSKFTGATNGNALKVSTSTQSFTFTYTDNNNPIAASGQFNSLQTLANAINASGSLEARITNDKLYIAATNGNEAIKFEDSGAGNFIADLGLVDVAKDTNRFSTLRGLKDLIKKASGLEIEKNNNSFDIFADSPTSALKMHGINAKSSNQAVINGTTVTVTHNAHGLANGDKIYVSGFKNANGANVPDGFYDVANVTANTFDITSTNAAILNGDSAIDNNADFQWQRSAITNTPTTAINTIAENSKDVQITYNGHGLAVGDVFTMRGLNPVEVNGMKFEDKTTYIVKEVVDANNIIIENENATNAAAADITASFGDFTLNKFTNTFKQFGLSLTDFDFDPAYNSLGGEFGKNLAEGSIKSSDVFTRAITIYDSLGKDHNFRISSAKIAQNQWSVEIHATQNNDGTFDIISNRTDGQIASGILTFDGAGNLADISNSLLNEIPIDWLNGANQSNVKFDFGDPNALGLGGTAAGVRQLKADSDVISINQNGVAPGLLKNFEIVDGNFIAKFTNGAQKEFKKVALAQAKNIDGLTQIDGNAYTRSAKSGEINLRIPGTGGVGTVLSGALEESNADVASATIELMRAALQYNANIKVVQKPQELTDKLFNAL